jgi:hypothetical protein
MIDQPRDSPSLWRHRAPRQRGPARRTEPTEGPVSAYTVEGWELFLRAGGGLYWLVPGLAFSLVVAVVNAWVLLVEVVR